MFKKMLLTYLKSLLAKSVRILTIIQSPRFFRCFKFGAQITEHAYGRYVIAQVQTHESYAQNTRCALKIFKPRGTGMITTVNKA